MYVKMKYINEIGFLFGFAKVFRRLKLWMPFQTAIHVARINPGA